MRKMKIPLLLLSALMAGGSAFAQEVSSDGASAAPADMMSYGEGLVPFRCPIEQIRDAYQNLVNPDDTLMALAIEKQTLSICRQSQEALIQIAENEMRLRELFEPIMTPSPPPIVQPPIAQITVPEPARNVTEVLPLNPAIALTDLIVPEGDAKTDPAAPTTDFVLGVLMRDPDGRKAILIRGEEMFTVRMGEEVTDGVMVTDMDESRVTIKDPDGNIFVLE
jgi:hypothetical protein